MNRPPRKHYKKGSSGYYRSSDWHPFKCLDCKIACTSAKQLEQHLNGIKHQRRLHESSKEGEENPFPLEHMVVLDQTEEDLTNDHAASPASCDSSDDATATSTSDKIPRNNMVVLDETNDDNDHPASPASCDSSASESTRSSPAAARLSDGTSNKKRRTKTPEDEQTAAMSPVYVSSCSSTHSAPESEAVCIKSQKSTGKKHHAKSGRTRRRASKKKSKLEIEPVSMETSHTFHIEPVHCNQDVYTFLKTFAIRNESDIAFANRIKEMFSNALRKYNERKLEEIFCTEAEHSSPEHIESADCPSNDEQSNSSMPQATNQSECKGVNLDPDYPANLSPVQCISSPSSSEDHQPEFQIMDLTDKPDNLSIASRSPTNIVSGSPTNIYEDLDTLNKPCEITPKDDNLCTDLLMEGESCVTAEASCSDDEDV